MGTSRRRAWWLATMRELISRSLTFSRCEACTSIENASSSVTPLRAMRMPLAMPIRLRESRAWRSWAASTT